MLKPVFTAINQAMRIACIVMIKGYRLLISPLFGNCCRFYPSCSCYAETAIGRFGVVKGILLAAYRLLRCHPFHPGGYDPVPKKVER